MRLSLALALALSVAPVQAQDALLDRFHDALAQPPEYNRVTREGNNLVVRSENCATTIPVTRATRAEAAGNPINRFVIRLSAPGIRIACTSFQDDVDQVVFPFESAPARDRAVAAAQTLLGKWEPVSGAGATVSTCLSGDCQGGTGLAEYRQDGALLRTYHGAFRDGRPHGWGSMTYADSGDVSLGEWSGGERRGEGVYRHRSGRTFVGTYSDDVTGSGVVVESDGSTRRARLAAGSYVFD